MIYACFDCILVVDLQEEETVKCPVCNRIMIDLSLREECLEIVRLMNLNMLVHMSDMQTHFEQALKYQHMIRLVTEHAISNVSQ